MKFTFSPKAPATLTSFRGAIKTSQSTPRGETRATSRASHEKKPSITTRPIKKTEISRTNRPRGTSSTNALKKQIPTGLGSFVMSEKDKSIDPHTIMNVNSMSCIKPIDSSLATNTTSSTKKLLKIPVKLRLKKNSTSTKKQPIHIRSMSDTNNELIMGSTISNCSSVKALQNAVKIDPHRIAGVTTPQANSTQGFHFANEEKMKEYKKAITVAANINSIRMKNTVPKLPVEIVPFAAPKNKVIRQVQQRLPSSQSVGSKHNPETRQEELILDPIQVDDEDIMLDLEKPKPKKNKIEQAKDNIVKWIHECIFFRLGFTLIDKKNNRNCVPQTTIDFYIVGRVLGKGAFGKVNLCLHKLSGKLIAMKSLHKQYLASEHNKLKFQNEIALLRLLKHRNIIRLYETFSSGNLLLICIELCGGGDLLTYVRKRKKLTEPVAKVAFKQVFF